MSRTRQRIRKRAAEAAGDPKRQLRRRHRAFFTRLGLRGVYDRLNGRWRDVLCAGTWEAVVRLTPEAAGVARAAWIARRIDRLLDDPGVGVAVVGGVVTLREVVEIVLPMEAAATVLGAGRPQERELMERMAPALGLLQVEERTGLLGVDHRVDSMGGMLCWSVNQFDRPFVTMGVEVVRGGPRPRVVYRVGVTRPRERRFVIEGKSRTAYGIGMSRGLQGFGWLSTRGSGIGGAADRDLPYFIQLHALKRVYERLYVGEGHLRANMVLLQSLLNPEVVKREGGEVWIEARDNGQRVGYLVATVEEDAVLIRTFLFLTMAGTPEAERLRKALRLRRYEVGRLRLDDLATYVNGDLLDDPAIVALFEGAGLGHLKGLKACRIPAAHVPIRAERARELLGLGDGLADGQRRSPEASGTR